MTAPLLSIEFDPDTRSFALYNRAAECLDQRLDVGEHN